MPAQAARTVMRSRFLCIQVFSLPGRGLFSFQQVWHVLKAVSRLSLEHSMELAKNATGGPPGRSARVPLVLRSAAWATKAVSPSQREWIEAPQNRSTLPLSVAPPMRQTFKRVTRSEKNPREAS